VKETIANDHAFSIEADIVKLTDVRDRLLIEGYIGKITDICFVKDLLEIKGLEGHLKINFKENEIQTLLNSQT
jgi:hypothetical protein